MPKSNGLIEPDVTINGHELTFAQAMALRVAVGSMRISLNDAETAAAMGKQLAENYDVHLKCVERMMLENQK
jgi:hypothetical protein